MLFFEIPTQESCFYFGVKGSVALAVLEIALTFLFRGSGYAFLMMAGYGIMILFSGTIALIINYILSTIFCGNDSWRMMQVALFWIGVGSRITPHIVNLFETHETVEAKKKLENAA